MENSVLSVTQIVDQIKSKLEGGFRNLQIEGEVTNLSCSGAGHWYFTLSDSTSSISVALFKGDALRDSTIRDIKDGDRIICSGSIGVYSRRGTFQIIARRIVLSGKGKLLLLFEQLKKKLAVEGLFDIENKLPIPELPKRVAIITAESGAALQDFLNIYSRRGHWMDIVVVQALVQGDGAVKSIRDAYNKVIKYSLDAPSGNKIDAIVLARGGGSLEDLWAFNDEGLAWDIFNCPIPTISAVGHQVDFTISDYVADVRCETPSAAAEVLTQGQYDIGDKMASLIRRLLYCGNDIIDEYRMRLSDASPRICVDILWSNLRSVQNRLNKMNITTRLMELTRIHEKKFRLDECLLKLKRSPAIFYHIKANLLDNNYQLLQALGPSSVLLRGYSYVKYDGKLISSFKKFRLLGYDERVQVVFHDGTGSAVVRPE